MSDTALNIAAQLREEGRISDTDMNIAAEIADRNRIKRDIEMFGQTTEEILTCFRDAQFDGLNSGQIYIMGILSDAQEVMSRGDIETARKFINKAKFLMSLSLSKSNV